MLLGIVDDPGDRQRRHRLRHARPASLDRIEIITYREYVGVSSALLLFVALVAPDVDVPRPPPARAAADVRPAADRRRLRARQGRRDRDDPVRLLVPAPGRAVRRQHARQRQRARLLHAATSTCSGRCRSRSLLLAVYYAVIGVAIASLTDRRIVAGAAIIGLFLVTSIASAILVGEDFEFDGGSPAALHQRARAAAVPARPRVPRPRRSRRRRSSGVDNGGLLAVADVRRRARRRRRRAAAALPLGGAMTSRAAPARSDAATTRRSSPTPPSRSPTCRCGSGRRSRCPS